MGLVDVLMCKCVCVCVWMCPWMHSPDKQACEVWLAATYRHTRCIEFRFCETCKQIRIGILWNLRVWAESWGRWAKQESNSRTSSLSENASVTLTDKTSSLFSLASFISLTFYAAYLSPNENCILESILLFLLKNMAIFVLCNKYLRSTFRTV